MAQPPQVNRPRDVLAQDIRPEILVGIEMNGRVTITTNIATEADCHAVLDQGHVAVKEYFQERQHLVVPAGTGVGRKLT